MKKIFNTLLTIAAIPTLVPLSVVLIQNNTMSLKSVRNINKENRIGDSKNFWTSFKNFEGVTADEGSYGVSSYDDTSTDFALRFSSFNGRGAVSAVNNLVIPSTGIAYTNNVEYPIKTITTSARGDGIGYVINGTGSITLSEGIENIEDNALQGFGDGITSFVFPSTIKNIGNKIIGLDSSTNRLNLESITFNFNSEPTVDAGAFDRVVSDTDERVINWNGSWIPSVGAETPEGNVLEWLKEHDLSSESTGSWKVVLGNTPTNSTNSFPIWAIVTLSVGIPVLVGGGLLSWYYVKKRK